MALTEDDDDNVSNNDLPSKSKPHFTSPFKQFYNYLKEKSGIPKPVFKGIKYTGRITLWGLGGFLTPGAIMMLGLFVLGLTIFSTVLATNLFLGASIFFAAFNIFSNLYNNRKRKTFDRVTSDIEMIKQVVADINHYLLKRENALLKGQGVDTKAIVKSLKGEISNEDVEDYENKLFFAIRGLYETVYHSRQRATKYYNTPGHRFLNHLNLAMSAIGQTLGQGFGLWIFTMMTINIFWAFPMWLILTVVGVGVVSGTIMFFKALEQINEHTGDENLLVELDHQLDRLRAKADIVAEIAPHVLNQQNEEFVNEVGVEPKPKVQISNKSGKKSSENVSAKKSGGASSVDGPDQDKESKAKVHVEKLYEIDTSISFKETKAVYDPLFVDLSKMIERLSSNEKDFSQFINTSSPYNYASNLVPPAG